SRSLLRPKFAIARAAVPIFSPSCGSTSTTIGPPNALHSLVWSVPAPGILSSAVRRPRQADFNQLNSSTRSGKERRALQSVRNRDNCGSRDQRPRARKQIREVPFSGIPQGRRGALRPTLSSPAEGTNGGLVAAAAAFVPRPPKIWPTRSNLAAAPTQLPRGQSTLSLAERRRRNA